MLQAIVQKLATFIRHPFDVVGRGDPGISEWSGTIPDDWLRALSPQWTAASSVEVLWRTALPDAEGLTSILAKRIEDFALLKSRTPNSSVQLLYVMRPASEHGRDYFVWSAGLPIIEASTTLNSRVDTRLPSSYRAFTKVHNGFLLDGWGSVGPRPVEVLLHLDTLHLLDRDELGYDPRDLLAFSGDGAGNEQCYLLTHPSASGDYWTADWDHETRRLGHPVPFWDYLERLVTRESGT